jgi:hypothetical protein
MKLKNLYIESTAKTPHVDLNHFTGELIFSGRSIPENAALIYEDILIWINEYSKTPKTISNLRLNLEYFNTASAIWISRIVKSLSSIEGNEHTLIIHIYFGIEDYDSMDTDEFVDELQPIFHMIGNTNMNVAMKVYGTSYKGEILKESMVLI